MILRRSLLWAAGVALTLTFTSSLPAGPPPQPPMYALDRIRDLSASLRARRVLQDDRALAALNLMVSVEDGVATISGPMPSEEVGRRAVSRLKGVRGIREVRPNFYPDPKREQNLLGDLVRREDAPQRIEVSKPDLDGATLPLPPRPSPPAVVTNGTARLPGPPAPQVFAPRPVGTKAPGLGTPSAAGPGTLSDRLAGVRASDPRFRTVRLTLDGTRVVVQQGSAPDGVLHDLLARIRHLPGVTDVELASE